MKDKVTLTENGYLYDGIPEKEWKFGESIESHMAISVIINLQTYFELRYLLKFACEHLDKYRHIEDAVNLVHDIEYCWQYSREELKSRIEKEL